MKILVFAPHLVVGGATVNAIELAAALRDVHGHDIVFFATPGPMLEQVQAKRLRFVAAPEAYIHPAPSRMSAVRRLVREERPDIMHVWDWHQCLDAYYSVHLPMRMPMVVTEMFMSLTRVLPKALPTTFGTQEVTDEARASGRRRVYTLLPPVDVELNMPGIVDAQPLRERYGIGPNDIVLATISRLDPWMKGESLHATIDAVQTLGGSLPLRFIIVGDGGARAELERRAAEVNAALDREAVTLVGEWNDPRSVYAAADIIIGMGGSALRGLAFGKPVVVAGRRGFCVPFDESTAGWFLYYGMYGEGSRHPRNTTMVDAIRTLASNSRTSTQLSDFSRRFVVEHFSLQAVSKVLSDVCVEAATMPTTLSTALVDGTRTAAIYLRERLFWRRSVAPTQNRHFSPAPATK